MRWAVLAALLGLAAPARAYDGTIVFTRLGGVFQQPAQAGAQAVQIADLPDDASEVRWAEAVESGRLIVLDLGSYPVWVYAPDPSRPAVLRGGPCTGRAEPSPGGGCVVCPTHTGWMLVAAGRVDQAPLPGPLDQVAFLGPSGYVLGAQTEQGIVAFDRRRPMDRRLLAKPAPRTHLLFSPDGKHGVAVFGEGDDARVRSFLLDGEGVSRQLGGPGIPTLWSWDSTWVLYEEGDIKNFIPGEPDEDPGASATPSADDRFLLAAPRRRKKHRRRRPRHHPKAPPPAPSPSRPLVRACVARAVGGEVKCWEGYSGMAFNHDSTLVLLKKGESLYVGKIAGVRPQPPEKIVDGVDGAATWVPGPVAAPMPPEGSPETVPR